MNKLYTYSVKNRDGTLTSLSDYVGKVLLIVNTATGCGFTPQYTGLQDLYDKYRDQGLEILDFPCDQFGHQAPGDDDAIHTFCTGRFGITFPQFAKINVNGKDEDPLFTYLKTQAGGLLGKNIKWNFSKFLIDQQGNVVGRFAPTHTPAALEAKITALL